MRRLCRHRQVLRHDRSDEHHPRLHRCRRQHLSGGDVTIDAWSNHITTGTATAKAGGFAADVRAYMTSALSLRHPGLPGNRGQDRGRRPCRNHLRRQCRRQDLFLCRWAWLRRRRLCRNRHGYPEDSQSVVTLNLYAIVIAEYRGAACDNQQHARHRRRQGRTGPASSACRMTWPIWTSTPGTRFCCTASQV